jgi:hypothetical protein
MITHEQIAEIARDAAQLLRICGWTRGTMVNKAGEYCLVGAVHRVSEYDNIAQQVLRHIVQIIEEQYSDTLGSYYSVVLLSEDRVILWNDAVASKEDALLVLDKIGASA